MSDDERMPWDPEPMDRDELFELAVERGVMRWLDRNADRIIAGISAAMQTAVEHSPRSVSEEVVPESPQWWLDEIDKDLDALIFGNGQRVARQIVQALRYVDPLDGLTRNELRALIESVPDNRPSKSTWHAGFALAKSVGAIEPSMRSASRFELSPRWSR